MRENDLNRLTYLTSIPNIIRYSELNGFKIFDNNSKPFNLNIWVVRSDNQHAGKFDDLQVVFYKDTDGSWVVNRYVCTADPSDQYLLNPINPLGTAIVKPGQHIGVWRLGYHKGNENHPALVQHLNKITVIRDFNRDAILDYHVPSALENYEKDVIRNNNGGYTVKYKGAHGIVFHIEDIGYFGINNHRAHINKIVKFVGKYSAGCIVQPDTEKYNNHYIPLLEKAVKKWGNTFSLTVVSECSLRNMYKHDRKTIQVVY